jgi:hypothetical protein
MFSNDGGDARLISPICDSGRPYHVLQSAQVPGCLTPALTAAAQRNGLSFLLPAHPTSSSTCSRPGNTAATHTMQLPICTGVRSIRTIHQLQIAAADMLLQGYVPTRNTTRSGSIKRPAAGTLGGLNAWSTQLRPADSCSTHSTARNTMPATRTCKGTCQSAQPEMQSNAGSLAGCVPPSSGPSCTQQEGAWM